MFAVGLLLSSNPDAAGDMVQVPSTLFQGSLLLGLISRATLGYTAMHASTVTIHPLMIAGWCGLTTSAFNMLPVGRLDGGRAVQGAFGRSALIGFGLTTYTLLGLGVLGGPLSLPWGLYVLICQVRGLKELIIFYHTIISSQALGSSSDYLLRNVISEIQKNHAETM
ncbi:hypothetical protein Q3G72_027719 [Acer saccharum]|nr:hypothetical protein Q3G72_012023 [Acer saccharum]KAK1578122.1 hypothetical protein Q3G72_027719 [Acer saccharum]